MKKINFPFFNPSCSAFICIETPPLTPHWCSFDCGLPAAWHWLCGGQSLWTPREAWADSCSSDAHMQYFLSCSVGPLCISGRGQLVAFIIVGDVFLASWKPCHCWRQNCVYFVVNSLPSKNSTLNSMLTLYGSLNIKIKLKGRIGRNKEVCGGVLCPFIWTQPLHKRVWIGFLFFLF